MRGSSTPVAATSVSLVGGEVTSNFDDEMGWAFANENLNRMRSPGPLLEVVVGTEVTLTFTNRGGWSQDADGFRDRAIPHSFRVVPSVPSPETMWGADTGLIEPDASATITFTPTEVGDYRYVSDGLGAAGQGMFGRFVVVEATESEPAADGQ
jgi:plastocyanin